MLEIDKLGIGERRSNGADDEVTGRNSEGDGKEDQLDGGIRNRWDNRSDDGADQRSISGVRLHRAVQSTTGKEAFGPEQSGQSCANARPHDCSYLRGMSEGACERCRMLLDEASSAISAHVAAVSLLAEAVSLSETAGSIDQLQQAVRATSAARQMTIECYENHKVAHELKVRGAGSGFPE